ncbi:hypothetical protein I547_4415, partial [Mycobacterium kansasii 824]
MPPDILDDLSRSMVVAVDNAVRTSSNELAVAIDEFAKSVPPRSPGRGQRQRALAQAFSVRQQLDDSVPRHRRTARALDPVIVSGRRPTANWRRRRRPSSKLRDLVINAPSRLDMLTQQYVELTTRIAPSQQRLAELHDEFGETALTSVAGNVT